MPFTPEELAEMAAADAEIEASFCLERTDLDRSRKLDRLAHFEGLDPEKQRVAAQQKAYREANKDKVAAMREYRRKKNGTKRREVRPEN